MRKPAKVILTALLFGLIVGLSGTTASATKLKVPDGKDIVPGNVTVVSQTTVVGKAVKKKPAKKKATQKNTKNVHKAAKVSKEKNPK